MIAFQKTLGNIDSIIGDEKVKNDLKTAVSDMPNVMRDMRDTLNSAQQSFAQLDNIMRNFEPTSKALDEQGPEMVNNLSNSVERLDELLGQVNRFSRALNNREGTLGQFIYNPELFDNLNKTVMNVNRLTHELEPVVRNAKIFSDKIARHPGVIIRDAVKPGPGLK
jgi:phospholipid/cholesterol/gamma-HCH transport system substrate-binding protein